MRFAALALALLSLAACGTAGTGDYYIPDASLPAAVATAPATSHACEWTGEEGYSTSEYACN